ncbi:hypothetical protein [Tabrizicola sp.]|jgi:hypothetical protein|uniref:hypothetical protein n=1 Tax=Tabrizicola sp. TaxID=2005166 RepID=UPI0025D4A8CC|nr:hypothetical protein [Tabrizicola sp.]MBY0352515.1 hypothetical protein [Tabrizicola sp.]
MLYTFAQEPAAVASSAVSGGNKSREDQAFREKTRKGKTMGRIIKALLLLVILGFVGLTGYAYLGDLAPVQGEVKKPVVLNAN